MRMISQGNLYVNSFYVKNIYHERTVIHMGIFSGLFRSRDKPTDRTADSSYAFYLGGSTSGKAVTERSAM